MLLFFWLKGKCFIFLLMSTFEGFSSRDGAVSNSLGLIIEKTWVRASKTTTLSQTKTPDANCIVFDGAAIIQMMKPAAAKKFNEMPSRYSSHIFLLSCAVCSV